MKVVGCAANGRDAVEGIKELCPDIAVLDIAMPDLNGIEATRQIQENCLNTQVIIFSMHDNNKQIFYALKAGARGYVVKKAAGAEVVKAIRTIYQGCRYFSESISNRILEDYLSHREMNEAKTPLARLSAREREVLQLVAEGKSSAKIADMLFLSPKTVETYRVRVMQKLHLDNLAGLVKFAVQQGLTSLDY
jgi:DNA-binding NarL/FixJ family response regulator